MRLHPTRCTPSAPRVLRGTGRGYERGTRRVGCLCARAHVCVAVCCAAEVSAQTVHSRLLPASPLSVFEEPRVCVVRAMAVTVTRRTRDWAVCLVAPSAVGSRAGTRERQTASYAQQAEHRPPYSLAAAAAAEAGSVDAAGRRPEGGRGEG